MSGFKIKENIYPNELAFLIIDNLEGGYTVDPNDPGGETKYGISKRVFPNEDIRNLTIERACELFVSRYYNRYHASKVPFPARIHYVDMCFNGGGGWVIQKTINTVRTVLNDSSIKKLKVDGIIGVKTLKSLEWLREQNPYLVNEAIISARIDYYRRIKNRPDKHYRSWMRRISLCINAVLTWTLTGHN